MALALAVIFIGIVQIGPIAASFALIPLPPPMLLKIAGALVVWTLVLREIWRHNWFERLLRLVA